MKTLKHDTELTVEYTVEGLTPTDLWMSTMASPTSSMEQVREHIEALELTGYWKDTRVLMRVVSSWSTTAIKVGV